MRDKNSLRRAFLFGVMTLLTGVAVHLSGRSGLVLAQTAKPALRLATLTEPQDKATLEYRSQGCFHGTVYRLEYTPTPTPRLTVTGERIGNDAPKRLGVVTLTPDQVGRLDNTLRFFRNYGRGGGCTTRDTLNITAFRDGYATEKETLEDDTCQRATIEDAHPQDFRALRKYVEWKRFALNAAPILSLNRVISFAESANQRGLATVPYTEISRNETSAYTTLREKHAQAAAQQRAEKMARDLPGYAAIRRQFKINDIDIGNINLLPYSLFIKLSTKTPHLVDAARWFDPVQLEKPRYNWNAFLQTHQAVEKAVARHRRWVSAWKKAGPGRTVESQIYGATAITEDDPKWFVDPAWKHAGLRGTPRYEVLLRRNDDTWLEVYFGDQEPCALVVYAKPAKTRKPTFWLDALDFHYFPRQDIPHYGTVTPDGVWRRNLRRDEKTPVSFLSDVRR